MTTAIRDRGGVRLFLGIERGSCCTLRKLLDLEPDRINHNVVMIVY